MPRITRVIATALLLVFVSSTHAAESPTPAKPDKTETPVAALRTASFAAIKAVLDKAPIKDVPWNMGATADKAVFDKLDESHQTLHAAFSGLNIDLKWNSLDNKQVAAILRAAGWSGDTIDADLLALSAVLLDADGQSDAAAAMINRASLKDAKVSAAYEALAKKYGVQAAAKPAPVHAAPTNSNTPSSSSAPTPPPSAWEPSGLSGGGSIFSPAISPVDPKMVMVNCDMGSAYISYDSGAKWHMIHYSQLRSNTRCKPAFHPTDVNTIFASAGWSGMKVSHDRGQHWENVAGCSANLRGEIAVDPGNPALMLAGATDGVWRSMDAGVTWKKSDGTKGEPIGFHFDQTSPADKRICICATNSGIFRSDDAGATWSAKAKGLPGSSVVCFSGGSSAKDKLVMLYCAVPSKDEGGKFTGGVYRSSDRGENWESAMGAGINVDTKAADQWSMGPIPQYKQVLTTNAKPNTVYAMNTNTGIYPPHHTAVFRSDDAGKNWQATFYPDQRFKQLNVAHDYMTVPSGQFYQGEAYGAAIALNNPDVLLQTDAGRVFLTTDGGKDWLSAYTTPAPGAAPPDKKTTWLNDGLVVTSTWNYYIDPFEANRHYICYTDIGFATSQDAGKSWQWWGSGAHAPWENTCYELAIDPKIPGKIWGAFSDVHDIPNGNIINGGHNPNGGGGVCLSTDFAQSWKTSNSGLPVAPALGIVLDPASPPGNRTLYAGVFGQGVFKSTDDGKSWTRKSQGLGAAADMRVSKIVLHPDGTLFAVVTALKQGGKFVSDGVGIYRSKDKAETWEKINASQAFLWPKDLTADPKDSKILYVGVADADDQSGGLWRTLDGGATWKKILRQGSQHFGAFLHPKHPGWIYATLAEGAYTSGLWLSKNNGETFTPINDLPFSTVQRIAFDPAKDNVIYAITFGGSIWKGPAE